ncbi:kinase-like domain-containing protein [Aspergillus bertholletiae]|uniref:Kinase-like domain-containing protein n=1 Tax=Aspergillus bertholletiae TaxID=1226010 RepID=A0A5N7BLW5_9EURO|nr:kinase-like domain-containing protein [Aspergillus bertholletiae]
MDEIDPGAPSTTPRESVFTWLSMANQVVSSLCERFAARLRDNSSLNYNRHRFYRNGTVRKVFDSNQEDLRQLLQYLCQANNTPLTQLQRVAQRVSTDLGVVFAILLFARGRQEIDVLRQFVDLALETGTDHVAPHQFTDIDLPISLETATNRFPLQGAKFYQKQFQFCAVTLMRREEVVYKGDRFQCPLPYLEETKIGEGAFGQVWKVRIEEQHFQSRSYRTATMEALELARKDFQLDREGENEQMILNTIRDQTRQHRHIMVALASLQYGPTYSLFFPLASCNLWEYLNGVGAEDRPPPSTLQEKSDIYWRGVTLAGALAFLHHEFRDQKFEVFSCYHLDLKPHNILVFDPYTPSETWKIADFGLSRVKGRGPDGEADVELVMPIIARAQRRPRRLQDPSTLNRRGEGTYLAPECSLPSGRVSSASDVWSLGCIISLVMSYIDSGYSGVVEFARQRRRQDHGDKFYTIRHGKPKLSPVVKAWYKHLMYRARASPFPMEHDIVCKTLDFLQKFVLHPTRDQRVTSREVEDTLMSISHLFHRKPSETSSRWWTRRPSMSASYTPDYSQLPLETGAPILGSGFALGGDVLLFHSPQKIQVFFPDEVLSAVGQLPEPRVIRIARASLECVASSSQFLCACLATACFECIFYEIASPPESQENGILEASRVCYPHMGSIKKVAMSANGLLTAFIIKQSPGPSDSDAFVYLSTTESLLNNAREG